MAEVAGRIVFLLFVFVVIPIGIILLQIFLSKKENKWAGLILPFTSLGISIMAFLGILLFSVSTGTTTLSVNGEIIEQTGVQVTNTFSTIDQTSVQVTSALSTIVSAVYVFIFCNIPTGILLAIYAACRGKRNKQRALEKMSVQDL